MAVAHKILVIAYHILRAGGAYQEYGSNYFDRIHSERTARRLTARLQQLGFVVTLTPSAISPAPTATRPRP